MTKPKPRKIRWTGGTRRIPDLGVIANDGDVLELPAGVVLGGEGKAWTPSKAAAEPKNTTTATDSKEE